MGAVCGPSRYALVANVNSEQQILTQRKLRVHQPSINNHWLSKFACHACTHLGTSQQLIHWLVE